MECRDARNPEGADLPLNIVVEEFLEDFPTGFGFPLTLVEHARE
jgi:hypothetical protein